MKAERDRLRAEGKLAGIGIATCLEPSGGNASFEPLLNPKNATTTWMDSCRIDVDLTAPITATMHTSSAGPGPRDAGRNRDRRKCLDATRTAFVLCARFANSLPSNSPVGSRMAIMLGGAAFHAAHKLKAKLIGDRRARPRHPGERAITNDGQRLRPRGA